MAKPLSFNNDSKRPLSAKPHRASASANRNWRYANKLSTANGRNNRRGPSMPRLKCLEQEEETKS